MGKRYAFDRIVCQRSTDGAETWSDGGGMGLQHPKDQDKEWALSLRTDQLFTHAGLNSISTIADSKKIQLQFYAVSQIEKERVVYSSSR